MTAGQCVWDRLCARNALDSGRCAVVYWRGKLSVKLHKGGNMGLFCWAVSLLIPLIITAMGLVMRFRPPKNINMLYGYRTARSMASREAWAAAHDIAGRIWLVIGPALTAVTVAANLALPLEPEVLLMILMALGLACVIAPIPYVETRLKEKFGK